MIIEWLILLLVLVVLFRVKIRGYFWRDKRGHKLSLREFLSLWGKGIKGITPLQQAKTNLLGLWITITGIISGISVNALVRMVNQWWWIEIILVGSLIITVVSMISAYQKYYSLKKVHDTMSSLTRRFNG